MPHFFVGNFDFEHELPLHHKVLTGANGRDARARQVELPGGAIRSDFAWVWLAIAEADDVILTPGKFDPADFAQLVNFGLPVPKFVDRSSNIEPRADAALVPWGWTASMRDLGVALGCQALHPPLDVVKKVNSRAFRFTLEQEWDLGLPGAALMTSLDELHSVLRDAGDLPHGWLLKANFGMSGREALRGRGTVLEENPKNWALKRLASGGAIVFEPMVERISEAGVQFEIPQTDSKPELVGITPLLVDRGGVYRGSRLGCPPEEAENWQPAVEAGMRVALAVQRLGYFGPLGIDAMRYRDAAGNIKLRALQDLNARFTMGRLALGLRRLLPQGWQGTWLHFPDKCLAGREFVAWLEGLKPSLPDEAMAVVTSPRTIGTHSVDRHAALVMAPTAEACRHAELVLFDELRIAISFGPEKSA